MSNRQLQSKEITTWLSNSALPSKVQIYVNGIPYNIQKELLAAKSAKVAAVIERNPQQDLSILFKEIETGTYMFELVERFCYGYDVPISTENVVRLICVAYNLEMTEDHSPNNLLQKGILFFQQRVLTSWNETIKVLRSRSPGENFLRQAVHIGLVDACVESIIGNVVADPQLLGEPQQNVDDMYRPNPRRRLFVNYSKTEDLITLPLDLYVHIIRAIQKHEVPSEYVAASIFQYAKKWVLSCNDEENSSVYDKNYRRAIIQAMETLLPREKPVLLCASLFEMLRAAISLDSSLDCRNGLEVRIGKQLDQATVEDLLIPSQGYANEVRYDIESIRRIVTSFYANYTSLEILGLIKVAQLLDDLLAELATDTDLKKETFISLAEMLVASSLGVKQNLDGVYRCIDIYLETHKYLTSTEREEVCRVLDCEKMSHEACEHAAKNERLPMRFTLNVLHVSQSQLRESITKEIHFVDDQKIENVVEEEREMQVMNNKVVELERECYEMRKEIVNGGKLGDNKKARKVSIWREMKRKLGCMNSNNIHEFNSSQPKKMKVHPK